MFFFLFIFLINTILTGNEKQRPEENRRQNIRKENENKNGLLKCGFLLKCCFLVVVFFIVKACSVAMTYSDMHTNLIAGKFIEKK